MKKLFMLTLAVAVSADLSAQETTPSAAKDKDAPGSKLEKSEAERATPAERKIDKTFIADVERSEESCAIAQAVIALGTNLGMTTVAEGIEEFEQLNRVRGWGCKYGQGFLLGPPMTADKIEDFIVTRGPAAQAPRVPPTPAPFNPESGETGEPPASSQAA